MSCPHKFHVPTIAKEKPLISLTLPPHIFTIEMMQSIMHQREQRREDIESKNYLLITKAHMEECRDSGVEAHG